MTLSFGGFGFVSPLLLAALPLAVWGLVYAYRARGEGNRIVVATTFLLKTLSRPSSARKKFVPPLRFWFEVLLLALLSLGAAGLFESQAGEKVAIVLDNSLQMGASSPINATGGSYFSDAVRDAESELSNLSGNAKVSLFTTAPSVTPVYEGDRSPSEAESALRSLAPVYGVSSLPTGILKLATTGEYKRIVVFTSRRIAVQSEGGLQRNPQIEVRTVSEMQKPAQNIAISNLSFIAGQGSDALRVVVTSYAKQMVEVSVQIEMFDGVQFISGETKRLKLDPEDSGEIVFTTGIRKTIPYRVHLTIQGNASSLFDALKEDNTAWISGEQRGTTIGVVGQFSPEELGLSKIGGYTFEKYGLDSDIDSKAPALVIYHRTAPSTLPDHNALFVVPPRNSIVNVQREISDAVVSTWDETHPVLNYLSLPELRFPMSEVFLPPSWMRPLISATEGVVAAQGEIKNYRYAVVGFEMLPFEGKRSPALSILTLNMIAWIQGNSGHTAQRKPLFPLPDTSKSDRIEYVGSSGEFGSGTDNVVPMVPGLLKIQSDKNVVSFIAVNLLDSRESNLLQTDRGTLTIPKLSSSAKQEKAPALYSRTIAWCVLGLLLLDILFGLFGTKLTRPSAGRSA